MTKIQKRIFTVCTKTDQEISNFNGNMRNAEVEIQCAGGALLEEQILYKRRDRLDVYEHVRLLFDTNVINEDNSTK